MMAPDANFVQAIPLYLRSDRAVDEYFRNHVDEIDAITGNALVVTLPQDIVEGNLSVVAALFGPGIKERRYPGLLRSDLPCFWVEDSTRRHEVVRLPDTLSEVNDYVRAMADAAQTERTAKGIKRKLYETLNENARERSTLVRVLIGELPVSKSTERLLAVIFGVVFVAAILALAVFIPAPTPFQYQVFRIVLSLAAAGFVSMTPGFLEVTVSNYVRAGGALAVFVIVFFYNPAALVVTH